MTELDTAITAAAKASTDPHTAQRGRDAWHALGVYLETLRPAPPPPSASAFTWDARTATLDPYSDTLVAAFVGYAFHAAPLMSCDVATCTAQPTDPLVNVAGFGQVRRPDWLRPGNSDDHHCSIVSAVTDGNFQSDLWECNTGAPITRCAAGAEGPLGAVNLDPGATAAHFPLRAGLIFADQHARRDLSHAVAFSMPNVGAGMNRYPASPYSANYPGQDGLRLGTWLRFPPDQVFPAMDPFSLYLCERIQARGMFLRDNNSPGTGLTFYGADEGGGGNAAPWQAAGLTMTMFGGDPAGTHIPGYVFSKAIPWSSLQVLAPPPKL